jgi:hypothetical protein
VANLFRPLKVFCLFCDDTRAIHPQLSLRIQGRLRETIYQKTAEVRKPVYRSGLLLACSVGLQYIQTSRKNYVPSDERVLLYCSLYLCKQYLDLKTIAKEYSSWLFSFRESSERNDFRLFEENTLVGRRCTMTLISFTTSVVILIRRYCVRWTRGQEEHSECCAREGVFEREDCNTVIRTIVFDIWDPTSRRPHMSMRFAVDARLFRREIRLLRGGLSSERIIILRQSMR